MEIEELKPISKDVKSESLEENLNIDNDGKKEFIAIYPMLPTKNIIGLKERTKRF